MFSQPDAVLNARAFTFGVDLSRYAGRPAVQENSHSDQCDPGAHGTSSQKKAPRAEARGAETIPDSSPFV